MKLTRKQINDLLNALDDAIELIQSDMSSNLPPKSVRMNQEERELKSALTLKLKTYRALHMELRAHFWGTNEKAER